MTVSRSSPRHRRLLLATLVACPLAAAAAGQPAAAATAPTACGTADLAASLRLGSPGAGQRYATLVLRNRSSRACHTFGYPGLLLVAANGRALPTRTVRTRTPAPRTVTLAPGGRATSKLHWTVVPSGREPTNRACEPTARTLQIIPPDQRTHLSVRWTSGPVCGRGTFDVGALAG